MMSEFNQQKNELLNELEKLEDGGTKEPPKKGSSSFFTPKQKKTENKKSIVGMILPILCVIIFIGMIGMILQFNASRTQSTKDNSGSIVAPSNREEMKKVLSSAKVSLVDNRLYIDQEINHNTLVRSTLSVEKKDGNYIFESADNFVRYEIGSGSLLTDATVETDDNTYDFNTNSDAMMNYDNTHDGNGQYFILSNENLEDSDIDMLEVLQNMASSDDVSIHYTTSGGSGEEPISTEDAEDTYDKMQENTEMAKALENQSISIDEVQKYLEKGKEERKKVYKEQAAKAKKDLKKYTKIKRGNSTYCLRSLSEDVSVGYLFVKTDDGNVAGSPCVTFRNNVYLSDVTFKSENEIFMFNDGDSSDSIVTYFDYNGEKYTALIQTSNKLDVVNVMNALSKTGADMRAIAQNFSDSNTQYFDAEFYGKIYKSLQVVMDEVKPLLGEKYSILD